MPITIVATAGASNANSFVLESEMDSYCAARLNASIWTGADAQLPALVEATREVTLLDYVGSRVTSSQALSWPREWAKNPDLPDDDLIGSDALTYYATDEVPQRVKDATCELALQFLLAGTKDLAVADADAGIIEKTVDVLTTRWESARARNVGLSRFTRVWNYLSPLLKVRGGGLDLVRV